MKIPREWTFESISVASTFDKHVRRTIAVVRHGYRRGGAYCAALDPERWAGLRYRRIHFTGGSFGITRHRLETDGGWCRNDQTMHPC